MKDINKVSNWYLNEQLTIDKRMVFERYKAIKGYFKGKVCLEMGPAEGLMTLLIVNDFEKLDIVDASKKLLDQIKGKTNIRKFCSYFEEFNPDIRYDTIIMDHVLEHIEKPIEVLKKVKNWLNTKGRLIIGVPNANSIHRLAAAKMGLLNSKYSLNERDKKLGHYRVYDFKELLNHIQGAGFSFIINKGGILLKPLSYSQMQEQWDENILQAFIDLGKDLPDYAAEIFLVVE